MNQFLGLENEQIFINAWTAMNIILEFESLDEIIAWLLSLETVLEILGQLRYFCFRRIFETMNENWMQTSTHIHVSSILFITSLWKENIML